MHDELASSGGWRMAMFFLFAVSAALLALALFVLRSGRHSDVHRWFASFVVCAAAWAFGIGGRQWGTHLEAWNDLVFAAGSLLPSLFFGFTFAFPKPATWLRRWTVTATVALGGILAVLSAATPLVYYEPVVTAEGFARKSGPLYPAFAGYLILVWSLALITLFAKWRTARGVARVQLRYVAWAFLLSGAGGMTTNVILPWLTGRSTYSWFGPYFGVVLIAFIAHTIIRHRLMDLRLVVHRSLSMTIATIAVLVPVGTLVLLMWPRLAGRLEIGERLLLIGAVVAVGLFSPFAHNAATRILDRYVYRTHASYQRTVREASAVLTCVLNLNELLDVLMRTLRNTIAPEGIAIYAAQGERLRRLATDRPVADASFESPETIPRDVVGPLARTRDAIALDHLGTDEGSEPSDLNRCMRLLNWSVVLPLYAENALVGAIAIGPKLAGDPFYREDLNLLMTLANQAGVALKNAERYEEVLVAHESVARIVASISSGVVAVNRDGQITLFNEKAAELTGLNSKDMRRRSVDVLPTTLSEALNAAIHKGEVVDLPEIDLPYHATARPIILTSSPIVDGTGTILGAVAVFSDLTPLKELETERRKAEKLTYFQMLASGVAHEIRNPLCGIKTFAQLLPRRQDDREFVEEFGRISAMEIRRIEGLLDRLHTLGKPSDRPHSRIDLRAPVTEAVALMEPTFAEKGVRIRRSMPDAPIHVFGDHDGLKQLALNLLMNAYEATPPDGIVMAEIRRESENAVLSVTDTGDGIPRELLNRLFEPFVTTKPRGTGLGLAISAGMAAMHGGTLRAANVGAGGAEFTLNVPLASATEATAAA
jgi:PAS domain S-box-containing protein